MTQAPELLERSSQTVTDKEGKYLTFALGQEEYGLEILKVREIICYIDVTSVPQTPDYVQGVIYTPPQSLDNNWGILRCICHRVRAAGTEGARRATGWPAATAYTSAGAR
jgi:hypothetical protein